MQLLKVLLFVFVLLLAVSCNTVIFLSPQPAGGKNLQMVPDRLCGHYSVWFCRGKNLVATGDSVIIDSTGFTLCERKRYAAKETDTSGHKYSPDGLVPKSLERGLVLSFTEKRDNDSITRVNFTRFIVGKCDSILFRENGNAFFLSLQPDWGTAYWESVLINPEAGGKNIRISLPAVKHAGDTPAERDARLQQFRKICSIAETKKGSEVDDLLDPSPAQLNQLIKAGFFQEFAVLKKQ